MMRWIGIVVLAVVGFVVVGDWIWWGIEVAENPPNTFYMGEFILRCSISIVYGAVLYSVGTRR